MRIVIGIPFPPPIIAALTTLRGSLPFIEWYDPNAYILTLCNIREINNYDLINELNLSLEKLRIPRFQVKIETVGYTYFSDKTLMLYATIYPSQELINLQKKIEHILRHLSIPLIRHKFYPRIALGTGEGLQEDQIANWLTTYSLLNLPPADISEFTLFSYYLSKKKPYYTAEVNYFLR